MHPAADEKSDEARQSNAPGRHIAYLALEAPREGQASYAHVFEIVQGLRRLDHVIDLYIPRYTNSDPRPNVLRIILEYIWLQSHLLLHWTRYDLIYVRAHNMAFATALIAKLFGRPIVHEVNGPFMDIMVTYPRIRFLRNVLRWLQRTQYRWADALIAVTPQLQRWLRDVGCTQPIAVIPNGANLELFNVRRERRPDLPDRYVVFFGGFTRWQGIPTMIAAASTVSWPAGVSLIFVGGGQLTDMVSAAAEKSDNIQYLGKLSYPEVATVVVGALAGLVPKDRQDDVDMTGVFPVKLFEILACGAPAIVTDYPGQADLVRSAKCGLVITPEDPQALANAVAYLAARPEEAAAMGRRGAELIAREHSWKQRSEDTAALISSTIELARSAKV